MTSRFSGNRRAFGLASATLALALAGCAAPRPASPSVLALPAPGEDWALFQQHDTTCRHYAAAQTGGQSPGQAADRSGVAGAVVGTGIGAGAGLLGGSLVGAAKGREAAAGTQKHYDIAYSQCMVANGEKIAAPAPPPAPTIVYGRWPA